VTQIEAEWFSSWQLVSFFRLSRGDPRGTTGVNLGGMAATKNVIIKAYYMHTYGGPKFFGKLLII
jgi:hypothetical protein